MMTPYQLARSNDSVIGMCIASAAGEAGMDRSHKLPFARSERLVIEELGDELLVYDLDVKHAHCLTPTAARVWRRCDGRTSPDTVARGLGMDTGEVTRALDELERCELLVAPVVTNGGLSRRDLGLRVAKVAAAAATMPLVLSIAAPAAAQTQTQIDTCKAIDTSKGCGKCNDGGTAGGPCCCCSPASGSGKVCAASLSDCQSQLGSGAKCTEKDKSTATSTESTAPSTESTAPSTETTAPSTETTAP